MGAYGWMLGMYVCMWCNKLLLHFVALFSLWFSLDSGVYYVDYFVIYFNIYTQYIHNIYIYCSICINQIAAGLR